MNQSLSAEVLTVVGAEPNATDPRLYRLYLDLKAEPGTDSTRLVLLLDAEVGASLVEHLAALLPKSASSQRLGDGLAAGRTSLT